MITELCCAIAAMGLHLGSIHVDPEPWLTRHGINNANTGAYVRFDSGLTVGTYRNTMSQQSVYAGWTWQPDYSLAVGSMRVSPAMTVGIVSGYTKGGVKPLATPSVLLSAPQATWGARIAYMPKTKQTGSHVVHFMIERKF